MYPHFIEVTLHSTGQKALVNIDPITTITPLRDGDYRRIYTVDSDYVDVKETYDELKELLRKAGTQIDKGDPRLNNTPLTWDTLTRVDMIGQPLWNSNTRKWMLLIDSGNDKTWIELLNDAGGHERWIEHDAQKFPLYRMNNSIFITEHKGFFA